MRIARTTAFALTTLLYFVAYAANAVPLASGTVAVVCGAGGTSVGEQQSRVVAGTGFVDCQYARSSPGSGSVLTTAQAQARFLTTPQLAAAAGSTVSGYRSQDNALANAGATMTYYMTIDTLGQAPVEVSSLPVLFSAQGSATVSGGTYTNQTSSRGTASVSLSDWTAGGPLVSHSLSLLGIGSASFDHTDALDLLIPPLGLYYTVQMSANCQARTNLPNTGGDIVSGSTFCSANVDPLFEFDQTAFDELMGPNTFALADYFAISLSENLVGLPMNGVPVVSSIALLMWGAIAMGPFGLGRQRMRC